MKNIRTILHPTDFSDSSQRAFAAACALARDFEARLIIMHVPEPPPFVTYGELDKAFQEGTAYRQRLEESLRKLKVDDRKVCVEYRLLPGAPATEILNLARESECDLIVMGTHGRTGLERLLMGSTAEAVLRKAPCPVMVVRGELPSSEAAMNCSTGTARTS